MRHLPAIRIRLFASILGVVSLGFPTAAQVTNGSFESGLAGWTPGPGASVEALQAGNFSPNTIPVPDGSWYALLSSGPGNITAPNGDFDENGINDFDGATLGTTITTIVASERLSLQWAFLTDDKGGGGQGLLGFDDLFEITINGFPIIQGSVHKPGGVSPFPDTVAYDGLRYTVSSPGATNGSDFGTSASGGRTPFEFMCIEIARPGTYTLEFLVADQGDTIYDSALLIDAVETGADCNPTTQVTNSSGSLLEVKNGGFVFTAVSNSRPAISGDGAVITFASNGDYNGDNPNLQEQIWEATRNGLGYDITRLSAAVGADFSDPGMGASGAALTFASTGDLVPPGNVDGNAEIFRLDRVGGSITQITDTAGCSNNVPTINDDGGRIGFVSDCDFGIGTTGKEIFLWDGTFRGIDTSGCDSRDPRISRDVAGRYLTFVTDCDGQYPGFSNPDGGLEIVQWDTQTDVYFQITDTSAGLINDGVSSSADGRYVSFLSSADHETGENLAGAVVPFLYDRVTDSFVQLADPDPLAIYTYTDIDVAGTVIAVERLDAVTGVFDIYAIETTQPRSLLLVAAGSPGSFNSFPSVALFGSRKLVTYLSDADHNGNNPDRNPEVWTSGTVFRPPVPAIYCNAPNLAIPDRNNQGVNDVITVTDVGTLADLDVSVWIEHRYVGDLRVELQHLDSGTNAVLVNRPGRPPGAGCSGDDIDSTLDDEAISPVENECVTPGPVAIQGNLTPNQSLDRFDGEDLSGDWRLTVSDRGRNNTGTFIEWCLIPSTQ